MTLMRLAQEPDAERKVPSQASLSPTETQPDPTPLTTGQPTDPCSLTINRVDVSGCYSVSGVSKATVSVEVGWDNAPTNEDIIVSTAGQSVTITPGSFTVTYPQPTTIVIQGRQTIVTPQVVAFELTLTGAASTSSVTAQFTNTPACTATTSYTLPAACPPTPCSGQLGGTVFRDFNADGIQQATETQGVSSVTVTAYDCTGTKYGPVVTDQFGKYTFTSAGINYPVRVEFSDMPGVDVSTIYGSNSKSNVQFVTQATCSVDLGVANPTLYCQPNPLIYIPCYTYGDPLNTNPTPAVSASNLSANADALVSFPYDESNTAATGMTHIAGSDSIGTVWGLGYNRLTKDLFLSATLHRHAGLGKLGLGGIYVTHTSSATVTTEAFINLSDLGIDVGEASVPENGTAGRGLSADKTQPSHDIAVFPLIGKVGIGGLEISEDGQTLWFVNLYDKKLYSIDLTAYNTTRNLPKPTLPKAADVHSYAIPDPGCTGGSSRPWALHVSGSKLYVGTVCDALSSQNKSDMRAYVYSFDPANSTFSLIFNFPLTYPKGYGISPKNSPGQAGADNPGWFPWTDTFSDLIIPTSTAIYKSLVHPQPVLADIEIDVDGSLVLGFADRTGLQGGYNNYSTDPNETQLYTVNPASGDILRAYYSNGSYILENNGKVGPFTGTGVNNNQGPGFGEFYDDNYFDGTKFAHTELALGGLALRLGSGHVVGATIDPVATRANSGGVKYWNNTTGVAEAAAIVYSTGTDPGTFAKAAGLGELDLSCDLLQIIEIGNRVWVDTNKDGVQDPCEKGLAGVPVDLYKGTTKIASTTTNASGDYYFSSQSNLTTGSWLGTGADTTLLANTAYSLVFGANQFSNNTLTVNGSKLTLTIAKSTTTNASNLNDSDASIATVASITAPVISLTTGNTGFVDHNFDVGFTCVPTTVASVSVTPATCNTATQTALNNGRIDLTGIQCADKAFLITTSTIPSYTATGSSPVSASATSFTGLANPTSSSGTSYSIVLYNGPCCYTVVSAFMPQTDCVIPCDMKASVTLPVCNSLTNTYTLTGTVSLTAARAGTLTITDGLHSTTVAVATNAPTAPFSLTGITSDGSVHTVSVVSSATSCGSTSTTYTAPASCTIAPPALAVVVGTPVCSTLTNNYTATGTVSLSNAVTSTLTITDNGTTIGTFSVTAAQASATFSVSGLSSQTSHTVVATLTGGTSASTTYAAPASCTVCSLSLTTNNLLDAQVGTPYSQTIAFASGSAPYAFSVSAGALPPGLNLNATTGVISGTPTSATTASFTLTITDNRFCTDGTALSINTLPAPVCSLTATATHGTCNTATNTYTLTGSVSATNTTANQSLTISVGSVQTTVMMVGDGPVSYTLTGLNSDGAVKTLTVISSATACGTTSVTYTAPASCSTVTYALTKTVDQSRVEKGSLVTYTISLTNTSPFTATNLIITDTFSSTGLTYVGSGTASVGSFSYVGGQATNGTWQIASLAGGAVATLQFQALTQEEGVLYNTVTAPDGTTAQVCVSVPVHVCENSAFEFELTAPATATTYQWLKDGVPIVGATTAVYTVTAVGRYSLSTTNAGGCPDGSCCAFEVVADPAPSLTALAQSATCQGNTALANAALTLVGSNSVASSYNVSLGSTYTTPLLPGNQLLTGLTNGSILLGNLPNPAVAQAYTIRVFATSGCYSDITVTLAPTVCSCPEEVCVPFVISQTKRARRIGDAR